ncbi:N-acetylmuramoyl-L-alanine amidase [Clostridium uliginosum]|uniref:N-acetylmuramoyl-L-alanine amidase n=1 Tax=Clostridium uliginosum TaxID=119641 RepID=A0A1I1N3X6_9CLOT|nr:N-acetylmuramoyl-L-alanine amidase [Clostridium uliginosum]SFC92056.1 N-acetylmuramoyl-L-alanine amidase [Clostridium uliginosum]
MNIKNKIITFLFAFAIILSFGPTVNVQATTTDVKIISDSKVTVKEARKWAKSKGATETFIDLADLYFKYSSDCGDVNPAIAYVQAAKETGYGNFGGVLDKSYHNPCGLKLKTVAEGSDTDKDAHQVFKTWDRGVQAHMDHLALYAGASGYPKNDTYDPRHFINIKGTAKTVNALGGKWAPSATYGEEINTLYKNLLVYAGVEENHDSNSNDSNGVSMETPKPGTPETKPSAPNATSVIEKSIPQVVDKTEADKPNIISTIGWKQENGAWYYYKSDNTKVQGFIKPDSNWYYLKDDGKMATGWLNDNGTWYYFNNSGIMAKGWIQLNNQWYYLKDSGAMSTGFINDGSNLYYLKDSGAMSTDNSGWTALSGKWYYFEGNGRIKTGWLKDNNNWYFLQGDGSMVTNFNTINSKNYLFNDSGSMRIGWENMNNYWYYFNNDGSMETGWINDGGSKYYLYDTGAMAKGWINLDGTWNYLKESGSMVTGWINVGSDSYYLEPSTGRMLTNTTIDGYKIGADGKKQTSSSNQNNNQNVNQNNTTNNGNTTNSKGKTIVIDPGHDYGNDYGCESEPNGVTYSETVLDMQVAAKLQKEFEKRGYTVVMTREDGEKPSYGTLTASLSHKTNVANNANADFFISIHHNSATEAAKGVETYYSTAPKDASYGGYLDYKRLEISKKMATAINNSIVNKIGAKNRGAKDDSSRTLFVLRNTNMPAVLVEVGFITNQDEALRCADSDSQQEVSEAIAQAVSNSL